MLIRWAGQREKNRKLFVGKNPDMAKECTVGVKQSSTCKQQSEPLYLFLGPDKEKRTAKCVCWEGFQHGVRCTVGVEQTSRALLACPVLCNGGFQSGLVVLHLLRLPYRSDPGFQVPSRKPFSQTTNQVTTMCLKTIRDTGPGHNEPHL